MTREIEECWVAQAIERQRRFDRLGEELETGLRSATLSVRSPDDLVEVRVRADGSVDRVTLHGPVDADRGGDLSRAIDVAVGAAAEAARWARRTLYAELLSTRAAG